MKEWAVSGGGNSPRRAAEMKLHEVTTAMWVNAWGVLPSCSPLDDSTISA